MRSIPHPVIFEVSIEFAIATLFTALRYVVRLHLVGFRNFRWDDYLALFVLINGGIQTLFTTLVLKYGIIYPATAEEIAVLDQSTINQLQQGSKYLIGCWVTYTIALWLSKACILFYYHSFSRQLARQQQLIKACGVFLAITFVACILGIFCHCTPISDTWTMKPDVSVNCAFAPVEYYIIFGCNLITDLAILAIPLPVFWNSWRTLGRKCVPVLFICTGTLIIAIAAVTCILSTVRPDESPIWGSLETLIWIIALNAPVIKPIFDRFHLRAPQNTHRNGKNREINLQSFSSNVKSSGDTANATANEIYTHSSRFPSASMPSGGIGLGISLSGSGHTTIQRPGVPREIGHNGFVIEGYRVPGSFGD